MTTVGAPKWNSESGGNDRTDQGAVEVVALVGEIDIETEPDARAALGAALRSGRSVVLDLSGVTFADSTALNLLLWASRKKVHLAGPLVPQLQRLLEIAGLGEFLSLHPAVSDALDAAAEDPT
ncbi:STAS domain-containing protein [Streptomyces sp. NPDC090032]|uniref:STAS domain-containing protein n=1 Tax=unclassified Streptomyces TaxID=2593676 RepID=UPI0037166FFD